MDSTNVFAARYAGSSAGGFSKANTAILRVAYLIAASDKDVNQGEREMFKKTVCALQGLKMGDDDTTEFIENVVEDARKLSILRDFYDEGELIKAFVSKVSKDISAIQGNKVDCRRAFAVWTSICMSDGEYSDFERKIVKALQAAINGVSLIGIASIASGLGAGALGMAFCAPIVGVAAAVAGAVIGSKVNGTSEKLKGFGPESCIPDAFLKEVEERCREIDEAQEQLSKCTSNDNRKAVEDSLDYLVESFNDFINNVES